jgi:hypothetical protein
MIDERLAQNDAWLDASGDDTAAPATASAADDLVGYRVAS